MQSETGKLKINITQNFFYRKIIILKTTKIYKQLYEL